MATPDYEPQPRVGHALVEYNGCTYLIGGVDSSNKPIYPSTVAIFNPATLKWQRHTTTGDIHNVPSAVHYAAYTVHLHSFYCVGGYVQGELHNKLWRLDLTTLEWSSIQQKKTPPARSDAGLVAGDGLTLILYGGIGGGCRTLTDLHVFSLQDGEWSTPAVTGHPPPPLQCFSFTLVGSRAVLFAGYDDDGVDHNDIYCLDIDRKHWSKELVSTGGPQPRGRWAHAAVALSSQALLSSGGCGDEEFDDCWILDLSTWRWREVVLPGGGTRRDNHAAAAVRIENTVTIMEFGGVDASNVKLAATSVLEMTLDNESKGGVENWRLVNYIPGHKWSEIMTDKLEHKRIYEEALTSGFIFTRNSVVVLNGAGGSGKTHVKEAISDRPPPSVRQSTALSEDAITFSIIDATDGYWNVMDKERQANMLASAMAISAPPKGNVETSPPASPPPTSASLPRAESTDRAMASATLLPPPTLAANLDLVEPSLPTSPSQHSPSPFHPGRKKSAHREKPHLVESDFINRIGAYNAQAKMESLHYDLVYLFDTGGQPAFHAILPLFFPLVMFIIFVLKLSEKLEHHPKVSFFVRGKPVGAPYTSPLNHLEIAQHSFSAVQSQMLAQEGSKTGLPKMLIVGTHRDKEWRCAENIQEKNRKLTQILSPSFHEHLIFHSAEGKNLVFPLDAKHRKPEDLVVSKQIRQAITKATSAIDSKKTPFSWHILQLAFRDFAKQQGRGFLSRTECITEAFKLDMSEEVFHAALDHFVELNTILYYQTILPDLVFMEAQPLMQKITELVQKTHALRGQVPDKRAPVEGQWFKFRDHGIVTLDILESFPDGYVEGLFTATDLIQLMQYKLLVSPIDQASYFMPVLLPDLAPEDVARHRTRSDSAIAPLSILFPCDLVPTGLFCSLVSSLLSAATPPQLRLKPSPSDRSLMECVASNCIKFSLPDNTGSLVLIDTYAHLELHLSSPLMENLASLCHSLKAKIFGSIATATRALHFNRLEPTTGFLCEASTPHAMVRVTPKRFFLSRLVLGDPRQVEVEPPTHPARLCGGHSWVCSLDPDHVHGRLQERHTVWLKDEQPGTSCPPLGESTLDSVPPLSSSPHVDEAILQASTLPQARTKPLPASLSPVQKDKGTASILQPDEPVPQVSRHLHLMDKHPSCSLSPIYESKETMSIIRPGDTPTLPLLICFPAKTSSINIPRQLGISYAMLGPLLLQDDTGCRMASLEAEHRGNTDRINVALLTEWLEGGGLRPVTWATLTRAIDDIGKVVLAQQLNDLLTIPTSI